MLITASGILKNPSFSGPSGPGTSAPGQQPSPTKEETAPYTPSSVPVDPQEARELTLQNTLQNAGPRRSSSARRASQSRRQSSAIAPDQDENDPDKAHLKWDEANLYLAEQESGTRMKITEPKTPYQFGDQNALDQDEDEEDVAIDPRYVNVDEVEMAKNKMAKKHRESEIPGLELGEPEEDISAGVASQNERVVRGTGNLSRESSKEKHVSVDEGTSGGLQLAEDEEDKHRYFEEQRKRHYEMKDIKGVLG